MGYTVLDPSILIAGFCVEVTFPAQDTRVVARANPKVSSNRFLGMLSFIDIPPITLITPVTPLLFQTKLICIVKGGLSSYLLLNDVGLKLLLI